MDNQRVLREAIANEYGFSLFRQYAEKEVCGFLKKDISTLKRWRAKGLIEFVRMGPKHVRYFGYQVADMLIHGVAETDECRDTPSEASRSGSIGSTRELAARRGTDAGRTPKLDRPDAYHLAQLTLKTPSAS